MAELNQLDAKAAKLLMAREWKQRNREHVKAYKRAYEAKRKLNDPEYARRQKERSRATTAKCRLKNPEKYREANRRYYKNNHQKALAHAAKWRKENSVKVVAWRRSEVGKKFHRDYMRTRIQTDPAFKLKQTIRTRVRNAIVEFKGGTTAKKHARTEVLLGCGIVFFKTWIEEQFKAGMSWANHGQWHIDHIVPLVAFDLLNETEQKKAFHYTNCRPIWKTENLVKGHRVVACQPELHIALN
jgi:hypothetical protein